MSAINIGNVHVEVVGKSVFVTCPSDFTVHINDSAKPPTTNTPATRNSSLASQITSVEQSTSQWD